MSLRTKLLAAVVGVPVAIQLVSLLLLVRFETKIDTSMGAVLRLNSLARVAVWTEFGRVLLEEIENGEFDAAYVMRFEPPDRSDAPNDYWTAQVYFDDATDRTTPPDIYRDPVGEEAPAKTGHALRDLIYARLARDDDEGIEARDGYMVIRPDGVTRGRQYAVLVRITDRRIGRQIYLVMVLGALATGLIGWWLLSRLVTDPLGKLAQTADDIAAGRPVERIPTELNPDEFGRTIDALNGMAREIAEYQGQLEDRVMSALERMKKAEQHLTIAQRLAATGTLTAGLAHEINNPLGGMKNAVQALQRGDLTEEQTELYLELVTDGLSRIEQMVKKFLSFTPRRVEAHPVDLVEIVEKSVALAAHSLKRGGIQLRRRLPPGGVATVYGDPNELQQVALNLLLNAADAMQDRPTPRVEVALTERDDEWVLTVQDNGSGIPEGEQDVIFDMFFTTKAVGEGSGMGLAVVHTIVTNHGGRIELESTPGEGSTFSVCLPKQAPDLAEAPVGARRDPPGS